MHCFGLDPTGLRPEFYRLCSASSNCSFTTAGGGPRSLVVVQRRRDTKPRGPRSLGTRSLGDTKPRRRCVRGQWVGAGAGGGGSRSLLRSYQTGPMGGRRGPEAGAHGASSPRRTRRRPTPRAHAGHGAPPRYYTAAAPSRSPRRSSGRSSSAARRRTATSSAPRPRRRAARNRAVPHPPRGIARRAFDPQLTHAPRLASITPAYLSSPTP